MHRSLWLPKANLRYETYDLFGKRSSAHPSKRMAFAGRVSMALFFFSLVLTLD